MDPRTLRLVLLPFKAYICTVPVILVIGQVSGFGKLVFFVSSGDKSLAQESARIVAVTQYGYAVCVATLLTGSALMVARRYEKASVRSSLLFAGLGVASAVVLYALSLVPPTR